MGSSIIPTVKPTSLPKLLDNRLVTQMPITMFTTGMNNKRNHHHGLTTDLKGKFFLRVSQKTQTDHPITINPVEA